MSNPGILDRPEVLSILFHPRPQFGAGDKGRTVMLPVAKGVELGARFYDAGPSDPLLLFFHGNGEIAADYDDIASLFTSLGFNMLVTDYRGYGLSGGQPGSVCLAEDALAVFQRFPQVLSEIGASYGPIIIMGRSLGSAAAIHVASVVEEKISALILDSPFADTFSLLRQLGGPAELEHASEKDGFGNLEKIRRVKVPTLIIHGQQDRIIPVTHARALEKDSPARRKRLVEIPGAGHNDLLFVGRETYLAALGSLIRST